MSKVKVHGPYPGYIIVIRRPDGTVHGQLHLWLQSQAGHMLRDSEAEKVFRGFVEKHREQFAPNTTFELKQVPVYVTDGVPPEIQNNCPDHGPQGSWSFCGKCGKPTTLGLKPTG